MCKHRITLKYEEYCNKDMCVLQRYMKEGGNRQFCSIVRERFKEVAFELFLMGEESGTSRGRERFQAEGICAEALR